MDVLDLRLLLAVRVLGRGERAHERVDALETVVLVLDQRAGRQAGRRQRQRDTSEDQQRTERERAPSHVLLASRDRQVGSLQILLDGLVRDHRQLLVVAHDQQHAAQQQVRQHHVLAARRLGQRDERSHLGQRGLRLTAAPGADVLERRVARVQLLVDGLRLGETIEHQAQQHLLQLVGGHELREDPDGSQTDGGLGHVGQHGDHQVLQDALQHVEQLVGLLGFLLVGLGSLGVVLLGVLLVLHVAAQRVERVEVLLARHAALTGPGQAVLAVRVELEGVPRTSRARSATP